ncbi:MAG: hypothetical protein AB8F95_06005 [Bacteroidia bacterium]
MKIISRTFLAVSALFLLLFFPSLESFAQVQTQTFTANGTLVIPAGATNVKFQVWGSGGGGGNSGRAGSTGGSGGGYAELTIANVARSMNLTIKVGAGGVGGPGGSRGGDGRDGIASSVTDPGNSFSITAGGGKRGMQNGTLFPGGIGTTGPGITVYRGGKGGRGGRGGGGGGGGSAGSGGDGSQGGSATIASAGVGGATGTGTGGNGGNGGGSRVAGSAGSVPGGGGGAGGSISSSGGGRGGNGQVIMTWTVITCDAKINTVAKTDEVCAGFSDGTITVTAVCPSCKGSLQYSIGSGFQSGNTFSGVAPNTYTVTVRDSKDITCDDTKSVTINAGTGTPQAKIGAVDYCKVQQALDAASSGDVIEIPAGTYTDCIMVHENITITKTGAGDLIFDCLTMDGTQKALKLGSDLTIRALTLTAGNIETQGNNITVSTVSGGSSATFIRTN